MCAVSKTMYKRWCWTEHKYLNGTVPYSYLRKAVIIMCRSIEILGQLNEHCMLINKKQDDKAFHAFGQLMAAIERDDNSILKFST